MIPGHKHLVYEEGLQSAWLYETLSPHVDELVVAGITQSRGPKSDKRDVGMPTMEDVHVMRTTCIIDRASSLHVADRTELLDQ